MKKLKLGEELAKAWIDDKLKEPVTIRYSIEESFFKNVPFKVVYVKESRSSRFIGVSGLFKTKEEAEEYINKNIENAEKG